jgi:hypothetical protein
MVAFFERTPGHLAYRLLAALEGGQLAGGDKRGQESAALVIVKKDGGVWLHNDTVLRLQVDDNPEPIKELRRLVEKAAAQKIPRRRSDLWRARPRRLDWTGHAHMFRSSQTGIRCSGARTSSARPRSPRRPLCSRSAPALGHWRWKQQPMVSWLRQRARFHCPHEER